MIADSHKRDYFINGCFLNSLLINQCVTTDWKQLSSYQIKNIQRCLMHILLVNF